MSFVTTPSSSSSPSARQSAATSELLPEPTGPPIPIRRARSGGKEPPLPRRMRERAELERRREAARPEPGIGAGIGCREREAVDLGLRFEHLPNRDSAVERQET